MVVVVVFVFGFVRVVLLLHGRDVEVIMNGLGAK